MLIAPSETAGPAALGKRQTLLSFQIKLLIFTSKSQDIRVYIQFTVLSGVLLIYAPVKHADGKERNGSLLIRQLLERFDFAH